MRIGLPKWFTECTHPKKVPAKRNPPDYIANFFDKNPESPLELIVDEAKGYISRFAKKTVQLSDEEKAIYGLQLFGWRTETDVFKESDMGIMLTHEGKPLAVCGYQFLDGIIVISNVQGVRQNKQWVKKPIQKLLQPLKWRHMLMQAGADTAAKIYEEGGTGHGRVYLIPAELQQWVGSHHAPDNCPFNLPRAKMTINRPARDVGFERHNKGLWYKEMSRTTGQ